MRGRAVSVSLLLAATLIGAAPVASAQEAGNVWRGQTYARQLCADCHSVERVADASPSEAAPPFAKLAKTSGMTGMALTAWMTSSHPTMPNIVVGPEKLNDIIAYILDLAGTDAG
jgi:mono/diheme cytochrome c family protein